MMSSRRMLAFWLAVVAQVAVLVTVPLPKALTLRSGRTVFLQVAPVDPYNVMSGYYATLSYDVSLPWAFYPDMRRTPEETTRSLVREYMSVMAFSPTTSTMAQLGLNFADVRREYPNTPMSLAGNRWAAVMDKQGLLTTATLDGIRDRAAQNRLQPVKTPFSDGDTVYAVLEARGDGEPWRPVRLVGDLPTTLPANQVALRGRYSSWRLEFGLEKFFIPELERHDVDRELQENRRQARAEIRVDAKGNSALVALHIGKKVWTLK